MIKSKEGKMIRVAVSIKPSQKAALDILSGKTRVPWSDYIREGIDMVLDRYKDHLKTKPKGG